MTTFPANTPQSTRQYLDARRQREMRIYGPALLVVSVGSVVALLQANALYLALSAIIAIASAVIRFLTLPRPHCLNCGGNLERLYAPTGIIADALQFCPYCGYALDAIPKNNHDA